MAERRMFAKTIIDSDLFLEMPATAQLLYFHLSMRADDDGFINKPKSIMRMCGCKDDDMNILIARNFVIPFDTGIVVIKHWKIHNYIRKDTYKQTIHKEEKSLITSDSSGAYQLCDKLDVSPSRICDESLTQDRIGKDRIGKERLGEGKERSVKRFTPPTLEDVEKYCKERKNNVDPQGFMDYYTANGWKVGKNPMKDWKATVRNWERNGYSSGDSGQSASGEPDESWGMVL